jgi:uncharacterized Zn finger protein
MSFYNNYPKATTAAQKKAKAIKSTEKLAKKNPDISPVIISGNKIAKTWWGISWNNNLESYSDYSNRIGRGRSYVRNGAVLDLQITSGNISALVQGSRAKPYKVDITIKSLNVSIWESITKACEGEIDSLQELIDGKFPKVLSDMFTIQGKGLFPSPKEISFECSCPDWANMCKHVAAVLYGVGARLDDNPTLFFLLRNVEIDDLISDAINNKSYSLIEKSKTKSGRVIEDTDISNLFGIDIEDDLKTDRK